MENYHVVYKGNGWEVKGSGNNQTYETKKTAIEEAKKIALSESRSVVIHTQDGKISSVISNGRRYAKGHKLKIANVKRRLNGGNVRNSIAVAMSERKK